MTLEVFSNLNDSVIDAHSPWREFDSESHFPEKNQSLDVFAALG